MCKACGRAHYNFVACSQVKQFDAEQREQARIQRNLAQPVLRPRANDWNNRYGRGVYAQQANQVAVVKRRPLHADTRGVRPGDS